MSSKPDVILQVDVVEQVRVLTEQRVKLQLQIDHLNQRMELLQNSLAENDHLAERVKVLTTESLGLFSQEWRLRATHYPDIWLASLEKAVLLAEPPKK